MKQAWHIFQKDFRRLWPYAAVWTTLIAIWLLAKPFIFFDDDYGLSHRLFSFFELLVPVSLFVLVAQLVHQEVLPGTTQFWLARPYDWRSLLGAKLLFLLLCVHLPLFVIHLLCFARNGIAIAPSLGTLLARHVTIFFVLGLVSMAAATLTRNLGQFALTALTTLAGTIFLFETLTNLPTRHWGMMNWLPQQATLLTLAAFAAAVTTLQYWRRPTRSAIIIAVAGLGTAMLVAGTLPWSFAMGVQNSLSPSPSPALRVHLAGPREFSKESQVRHGFVRIRVPVTFDGLADRDLETHNMKISFRNFDSAWKGEGRLERRDERIWFHVFDVPQATYARFKHEPVRLGINAFVSTFRPVSDHRIPASTNPTAVPGVGRCGMRESSAFSDNRLEIRCLETLDQKDRVLIRVEKDGATVMPWRIFHQGNVGLGGSLGIMPLYVHPWGWLGPRLDPTAAIFRRLQLEASFPLNWTYDQFKLADYVTWEPDQRRR